MYELPGDVDCPVASFEKYLRKLHLQTALAAYGSERLIASKLLDHFGTARHMVRVSGHKSEMSIRSYSRRLCADNQQQISDTLAKTLQKKPNVTSIYQQAPINPPNETATSWIDISDLDENAFIELEVIWKENHPQNVQSYVKDKPVVTQESTNIVLQPVTTIKI
ncbi:hypothetical protein MAR_015432, partial [Mya arenaria]